MKAVPYSSFIDRRAAGSTTVETSMTVATTRDSMLDEAEAALREANLRFSKAHTGESAGRQPVHTVYGGAQLFAADSVPKLGAIALRALNAYAPDALALGKALGIDGQDRKSTRLNSSH